MLSLGTRAALGPVLTDLVELDEALSKTAAPGPFRRLLNTFKRAPKAPVVPPRSPDVDIDAWAAAARPKPARPVPGPVPPAQPAQPAPARQYSELGGGFRSYVPTPEEVAADAARRNTARPVPGPVPPAQVMGAPVKGPTPAAADAPIQLGEIPTRARRPLQPGFDDPVATPGPVAKPAPAGPATAPPPVGPVPPAGPAAAAGGSGFLHHLGAGGRDLATGLGHVAALPFAGVTNARQGAGRLAALGLGANAAQLAFMSPGQRDLAYDNALDPNQSWGSALTSPVTEMMARLQGGRLTRGANDYGDPIRTNLGTARPITGSRTELTPYGQSQVETRDRLAETARLQYEAQQKQLADRYKALAAAEKLVTPPKPKAQSAVQPVAPPQAPISPVPVSTQPAPQYTPPTPAPRSLLPDALEALRYYSNSGK